MVYFLVVNVTVIFCHHHHQGPCKGFIHSVKNKYLTWPYLSEYIKGRPVCATHWTTCPTDPTEQVSLGCCMSGHRAILWKTAVIRILGIYTLNLPVDAVQINTLYIRQTQIFQTQTHHPKILDARSMTWRKFHTRGPQILGDPVHDPLGVARHPGFVHPCYKLHSL